MDLAEVDEDVGLMVGAMEDGFKLEGLELGTLDGDVDDLKVGRRENGLALEGFAVGNIEGSEVDFTLGACEGG